MWDRQELSAIAQMGTQPRMAGCKPLRVRSKPDGIVAAYRSDTGSDRICHRTPVGTERLWSMVCQDFPGSFHTVTLHDFSVRRAGGRKG